MTAPAPRPQDARHALVADPDALPPAPCPRSPQRPSIASSSSLPDRSGTASSSLRPPMPPHRPTPAPGLPCDPCRLVEAIGGGGTVTPPLAQLRVAGIAERDQVALVVAVALRWGNQMMVLQLVLRSAGGAERELHEAASRRARTSMTVRAVHLPPRPDGNPRSFSAFATELA